jgi:23S rRNA pseudouridine2605 synthase
MSHEASTHSLPRALSKWGVLSRAAAERAIAEGRVALDGRVCRDPKRRVTEGVEQVALDGQVVVAAVATAPLWYVLNKPRGVLTSPSATPGRPTVLALLPPDRPAKMAPVGSLDVDACGLLLLTDDRPAATRLSASTRTLEHVYRVKVRGRPSDEVLSRLETDTIEDAGQMLGPLRLRVVREGPKSAWLEVRVPEGGQRSLRRRLTLVNHEVEVLIRESIGPITLGELAPGEWRVLTPDEVRGLVRAR